MTHPRIAPLPTDQWGEDAVAAIRGAFGDRAAEGVLASGPDAAHVPNVLTTLMHHPALAGPFLTYNAVLLNTPTIEPRLRELMILRVAWLARSPYEWLQHVRIARGLGVTDEELEAIGAGADADGWTPLEAAVLAATDQLLDRYRVDDATWSRLAEDLDPRQLVELTFVVGTYAGLAMSLNSLGIELDPDLDGVEAPPLPDA